VQEVLQADWQEDWHLPQPPFSAVAFRFALLMVTICFKKTPHFLCFVIITHLYYNTVGIFFQVGFEEKESFFVHKYKAQINPRNNAGISFH